MRAAHERNVASKGKGPSSPAAREWHSLLALQPSNLDPDSEMRKYCLDMRTRNASGRQHSA